MKYTVFTVMTVLLLIATLCHVDAQWSNTQVLSPNGGEVNGVAFVNNTYLISASGERLVRWNVNDGSWTHYQDVGSEIHSITKNRTFNSGIEFVAYGKEDGHIGMRYTDDLGWRGGWHAHTGPVTALDGWGSELVSGEHDPPAYVKSWNVENPTKRQIVSGSTAEAWSDGVSKIWDIVHRGCLAAGNGSQCSALLAFGEYAVDFWNMVSWDSDPRVLERYSRPNWSDGYLYSVDINSDRDRVAAGCSDDNIYIFDEDTRSLLYTLVGHTSDVDELDFHPSRWWELASGSDDDDIHVWDITEGTFDLLSGHPNDIQALAYSPNGNIIASGCLSGEVRIWVRSGAAAPDATSKAQPPLPIHRTALLSNYPNPFNPETWIPYQLSEAAEVTVTIHASDGKLVRTLELGQMPAGAYSDKDRAAYWDGQNAQGEPVASGVYFYTLRAGDFSATRKMVIRK